MTDYVRQALARHLGVSVHSILRWSLTTRQDSIQAWIKTNTTCFPGMLSADLEVELMGSRQVMEKLATSLSSDRRTSLAVKEVLPSACRGDGRVSMQLTLLRGKETQHLFKAMHQMFTVRGPHKRKKK